jgi:alpha-amylase
MARDLVIYTVVHQPRRLRLPAQPIPRGASAADIERCLFDEALDERYFRKAAERCYWPATEMFLDLLGQGARLNIGLSWSFVRQAQAWDPALLSRFARLIRHPGVELVAVEPYHSFLVLLDLERFVARMVWVRDRLEEQFGRRPVVADTTELCMSDPIYLALDRAGFAAGLLDGRPAVLGSREPTFLYHDGRSANLLVRHHRLSDDVGYRFSDRRWNGWPLLAPTYADWLAATPGDLVVLGWDFETFGEHHAPETGIFEFMRRLPDEVTRRGLRFATASEAIAAHRERARSLPLPATPVTWAGSGGLDFFLGNPAQQAVFQLMLHAYNKARLTGDAGLVDLALWLMQSDNLHVIQWYGRSGSEAEVSAYFTPREWWALGPDRIVREIQAVYAHFIRALGAQPPLRLPRGPAPGRRGAEVAVADGDRARRKE